MIRVECECGKAARVPSRYAGRMVKCSGCGGKIKIPDPDAEEPEQDDAEGEENEEERPRGRAPRRKGSRVGSRVGSRTAKRPGSRVTSRAGGAGRAGPPKRRRRSSENDDPYAPPSADLDEDRPRRKGGRKRGGAARDLTSESHIMAIGIWQCVTGVFLLLGALAFFLLGAGGSAALPGAAGGVMMVVALVILALAALYFFTGRGLMTYKGWARIVMAVLFGLNVLQQFAGMAAGGGNPGQLVGAMIGLGWQCAVMWALFNAKAGRVFSPRYQQEIRGDRRPVPWASSVFFWLPLVFIVLIFGIVILAVFAAAM